MDKFPFLTLRSVTISEIGMPASSFTTFDQQATEFPVRDQGPGNFNVGAGVEFSIP
ncbi:uncharacterized protein [Physcomitrium patens]|uniref:uncharacterized protein n=1 Tax=Physcomitrium patens TaxID=3218 RepID=UPI003CCD7C28